MKKLLGLLAVAPMALAACGGSADGGSANDTINVYVRNSSSGTREAFTSAISDEVDSEDNEALITGFSEQSGTSAMIAAVEGDDNGIGYISLASLPGTDLEALSFNGVKPTNANVTGGDYKMSRDFAYVTSAGTTPHADITAAELAMIGEWQKFVDSKDGEATLEGADVIVAADANAVDYAPDTTVCDGDDVTLDIGGSTSVEDAGKAISEAFALECGAFKANHSHAGSSASEAVNTGTMHIGFSSSGHRDNWDDKTTHQGVFGQDAVVVVVNEENDVTNLTTEELQKIFFNHEETSEIDSNITSWADLA